MLVGVSIAIVASLDKMLHKTILCAIFLLSTVSHIITLDTENINKTEDTDFRQSTADESYETTSQSIVENTKTQEERVPYGPQMIVQPHDGFLGADEVVFSCQAVGNPTPTYTWYKLECDDEVLKECNINSITESSCKITGGNLTFLQPTVRDRGTYFCVAENEFGRVRSENVQLEFDIIDQFNVKRSNEAGLLNWGKALFCDPPQCMFRNGMCTVHCSDLVNVN